jgi:hypothetical protein
MALERIRARTSPISSTERTSMLGNGVDAFSFSEAADGDRNEARKPGRSGPGKGVLPSSDDCGTVPLRDGDNQAGSLNVPPSTTPAGHVGAACEALSAKDGVEAGSSPGKPGNLGPSGPRACQFREAYGWNAARMRPPVPSPADIDMMDEALGWLALIPNDRFVLRRIVGARALVAPLTGRHLYTWRRLGRAIGADHRAVQRWHADGIRCIARGLGGVTSAVSASPARAAAA